MNSKQKLRARIILGIIIAVAIVLASALYWTQIVKGEVYAAQAQKQYTRPISSLFDRGSIFFSPKGEMRSAAATIATGYIIYMNPSLLSNPEDTYEALSQYVEIDRDDFLKKALLENDPYEELLKKVDEDIAESIRNLSLSGIGVTKESWRVYPGNDLSAQTLGIIGADKDGNIMGRYGLESTYEDTLTRKSSSSGFGVFAQIFSGIKESVFGSLDNIEGNIITTIEPTVGKYVEKVLTDTSAVWKPDTIGAIVMDPKSGEIVAMSSLPSFNPNDLSNISDANIFSNPLVEHVYEMGSIMKPLTVAVGLNSKAIDPAFKYDDTGTMTLSGKKISNYDGKARGPNTSLQQVLSQSLNIGVANIALKIGKDQFSAYFKSFGLGEKTGIDQPNEATGIITNLETGREVEIATAAYGQGLAISPISMTRALSIIANGGYLVTPHLVKEIEYYDGTSKKIEPQIGSRVLEEKTADEVTRMLVEVVDTALLGGKMKMADYTIAAKTGTAQIPDPSNKTYYTDRYLHSFFGYFPAYDPKFIVFLYQVHPKGAQYASETLAEPFGKIASFLIGYYNIEPDR